MRSGEYEVILAPAAVRAVLGLGDLGARKELADALRVELAAGPNAGREIRFDSSGNVATGATVSLPAGLVYTATPLSFSGYTAIHRPMTDSELKRLKRERGGPVAGRGFHVLDLLPPEAAFIRSPRF